MSEIIAAWRAGAAIQYFVIGGYDSEWTDYTNPTQPEEQIDRLVWRIKPPKGT